MLLYLSWMRWRNIPSTEEVIDGWRRPKHSRIPVLIGLPDNSKQDLNLTSQHKTRLFSLALSRTRNEDDIGDDEKRTDILYDLFTGTLPVPPRTKDRLPPSLRNQSESLRSVAGQPICDLLQDPQADVSVIQRIKDYAKESGAVTTSKIEKDALLALYYAAIASALLLHGTKISKHSWADLTQFFRSLATKKWVLPELKTFFLRAQEHCKDMARRASDSL